LRRAVPDVRGPILLRVDLPRGRVAYAVVDVEGAAMRSLSIAGLACEMRIIAHQSAAQL